MLPLRIRNSPFHRIGDSYGHFFDTSHFMGRNSFDDLWMTRPLANILKGENEYTIELTMPGFKRNEINVDIQQNILIVSTEKREPVAGKFLYKEVPGKLKERTFEIPDDVDQDRIHAKLEKGILTVYMPHKVGIKHISRHVSVD
jgi:HSP20 family protein